MAAKGLIRTVVGDLVGLQASRLPLEMAVLAGYEVQVLAVGWAIIPLKSGRMKLDQRICVVPGPTAAAVNAFWALGACDLILVAVPKSDRPEEIAPMVDGILSGQAPVVVVQAQDGLLIPVMDQVQNEVVLPRIGRICVATDRLQMAAAHRYGALESRMIITGTLQEEEDTAAVVWEQMEAVMAGLPVPV